MSSRRAAERGVTLVEVAIVLAVVGLLLGAVLKGQELINNAKVRAIADRQISLRAAWFAFIDRYQAMPGDYADASGSIVGAVGGDGDGNIAINESPIALQHLTGAGYLHCPQCTFNASPAGAPPTAQNSLQNQYGGVVAIFHDSAYYATIGSPVGNSRLFIHTGHLMPSNIAAEIDRKLDDGHSNTGEFVFNDYTGVLGAAPIAARCMASAAAATGGSKSLAAAVGWRGATAKPPVEPNCGASLVI